MKKLVVTALFCLLVISAGGGLMADDGYPIDRAKIADDIVTNLSNSVQKQTSASWATGGTTSCVNVDIELPDSFTVEHFFAAVFAEGYFEIINCGDDAADIQIDFSVDINLSGIFDTIIYFPGHTITLSAGETVNREIRFPVPPFEGSYTVCLYASSGDVADTACATMNVAFGGGPGIPIDACGVLTQGEDCVLFSPMAHCGDAFVLSDYGDFQVNDTVLVNGNLNMHCETDCIGANGCIDVVYIESCGFIDPVIPFQGCGVLVNDTECVVFEPFHHPDLRLTVENLGDFGEGDTVFINGDLVQSCDFICPDANGCILGNEIRSCNEGPNHPFEAQGIIVQTTECIVFVPFHHDGQFLLDNMGEAIVGDTVFVAGDLDISCVTICGDVDGCIHDNFIEVINMPGDPTMPFNGIGVLLQNDSCVLFSEAMTGELLVLDYLGDYVIGDTVCVAGILDVECETDCAGAIGCVEVHHIQNCGGGGTNPDTVMYRGRGILVQDTNCVLYFDELTGEKFLLTDYTEGEVGDTVCVIGILDLECASECPSAVGCIVVIDTYECGNGGNEPPPVPFHGMGLLLPDSQCVYLADFESGANYYLDNYGEYAPYDTVCIFGFLSTSCDNPCLIDMAGCVEVHDIIDCGGGDIPDTTYYRNVGVLLQGAECVIFSGANDDRNLVLDFYGDFVVGDTVCVEGFLDESCETACAEAEGCLQDNSIVLCGGDPGGNAFEAPGVLVTVGGCLLFSPSMGMMPGAGFTLDNYGDFSEGDNVFVTGSLEMSFDSTCLAAVGHIAENTIVLHNPGMNDNRDLKAHNYPNPFNPVTTISFDLPASTKITVTVHNILGQMVTTLIDGESRQGPQTVTWEGTDNSNQRVASGIYFYRIQTDDTAVTRKMVLTK